ncbi:MAG: ABC transporter permease [Terriglobia bacterium]
MGVWIMAGVTFREAARKKVLWMALAAGCAFLVLFGAGLHYQVKDLAGANSIVRRQVPNAMLIVGIYAVDLLAMVITVLASADTLSGEIASGTIHAVATKPVTRWEVLLGKWLGFVGMMTLYIGLMVAGVACLAWFLSGATALHLCWGVLLIWLESIVLLNVTLLCGASLSTLTSGVLVLGLYALAFLGGWIEQVGALTRSPRVVDVGVIASIIMPSESLWRRAAFEMQSPVVGALRISPFSNASVPSAAMIGYAVAYLAIALALAGRSFGARDL